MRLLALIPARGGSKRLPGKNIRPLGGTPLIGWTLCAARASGVCTAIRVSTDDPAIAEVAAALGAPVEALRPAELSTDLASSMDVVLYELERHEAAHGAVDAVLLLQPTSPFRRTATIRRALEVFLSHGGARPVVSVSPAASHPAWCFRCDGGGMEPLLGWEALQRRSQDLEPVWALNGALYLAATEYLRRERRFLSPDSVPLPMDDEAESLDIDTADDWAAAEALLVARGLAPETTPAVRV